MPHVSPVRTRSDWKAFLHLPWRIYRDLPNWVPPILSAQKRELDPKHGPFFRDGSTAEYFLARRDNEVVGRIAAIRNERHLARQRDRVGFFGFFESIDDVSVASALLSRAEEWLSSQGLAASRGPASFTINDPAGVTIRGAEIRPTLLTGYTPGYYAGLLEACGYHKIRDLLGYHLSFDDLEQSLFRYESAFTETAASGVRIRHLDRAHIERDAEIIARVFSESWDGNWGSFPIHGEELVLAAKELGPYFDERLGYIATVYDEPAGVFLTVPDPWEIIQKLNGRIGPTGWIRLAAGRNRVERCRLIILGALPRFRHFPIQPLMLREIQKRRDDYPAMRTIELFWILEDNRVTCELAGAVGGKHVRTQRIYEKFLDP